MEMKPAGRIVASDALPMMLQGTRGRYFLFIAVDKLVKDATILGLESSNLCLHFSNLYALSL